MVLLTRLDCPRFGREDVLHRIAFDYPQTHFRGVPSRNADTRLTGFSRRKSPGLFWPGLDGCGAECDLFVSADREGNPLRVPPAPSGGRRAVHRGIPGYGPPRSGRKQNLPGCCCWGR